MLWLEIKNLHCEYVCVRYLINSYISEDKILNVILIIKKVKCFI